MKPSEQLKAKLLEATLVTYIEMQEERDERLRESPQIPYRFWMSKVYKKAIGLEKGPSCS